MKKLTTSKFLLDNKSKLQEIIKNLETDFKYVSILGCDVDGASYSVTTSAISLNPSPDYQRGFVIRVYTDLGFSEYSFNEVNVDEVCENVRKIALEDRKKIVEGLDRVTYDRLPNDDEIVKEKITEVENLPEQDNPEKIITTLQKIHDEVKSKYEKIVQLSLRLNITQVNKIFLSKNKDLYQSYAYSTGFAMAAATDGNNTKLDFISSSGLCGSELISEFEKAAEDACRRTEELLTADRVVPGEYDIICDPDFTGLIAHEAFGHGAEMDMYVKERAKGKEYQDKRVASDKIIMHDGATAFDEVSSYLFDDEGNLGRDTVIIDKGILRHGMCDELSAILLGQESTGNGKRESFKRKVYTRMTNTFFEAGEDSVEDMIKSVDKGYLLEGFSSGMEDPKNWGIQCVAMKGREIIDGKLTGKIVSPVYLTGYVPDLLQSITQVSNGLVLSGGGYCGKGWKEWVKTSTGGSYIKAKGILS